MVWSVDTDMKLNTVRLRCRCGVRLDELSLLSTLQKVGRSDAGVVETELETLLVRRSLHRKNGDSGQTHLRPMTDDRVQIRQTTGVDGIATGYVPVEDHPGLVNYRCGKCGAHHQWRADQFEAVVRGRIGQQARVIEVGVDLP